MKKKIRRGVMYLFLITVGIVLIYPLVWMFFATFKTNAEIFGSSALLPTHISLNAYIEGWKSGGGVYSMGHFMKNTFLLVVPSVLLTVISSTLVGYGFARFDFPFKGFLFAMMLSTLMLPGTVTMIPKYLIFNKMGWLNTYLPFIVPAALGSSAFLIYMVLQFIRGIPTELDESAKLDGCSYFQIYTRIMLPLSKPVIAVVGLYTAVNHWNDWFAGAFYMSDTSKWPVQTVLQQMLSKAMSSQQEITSVAQALAQNATAVTSDSLKMAAVVITTVPILCVYPFVQKYFAQGAMIGAVKG